MSSDNAEPRTVVICGSMKNLDLMTKIGKLLESAGLDVVTPVPDTMEEEWSFEGSIALKREASRRHMDSIRRRGTVAVLVVNVDRADKKHYVGPNSLAEIGVAFSDNRRVFLLQGMPDCYVDELMAWGVECLNGDLPRITRDLGIQREINPSRWQEVFSVSMT
jgi:hypothetical protein